MAGKHSVLDEGTDVGLLGGVAVAVFFLVLDTIAGVPLRTPSVLGQVLLFGDSSPDRVNINLGATLLYTVVHFAAFALLGMLLTKLVHLATHNSVFRFALLPFFLVFELFFYGVITAFAQTTRELFPFWTVIVANTIAVVVMAWYLWRNHPAFRHAVVSTPLGAAEDGE